MLKNIILWKANIIAFISSFCVMVIELVASRILAPHIGVSLYTWTSVIGVILAGIAIGNFSGGKIADKYPSPLVLVVLLSFGGLLTVAILPATKIVTSADFFGNLPIMLNFTLKTSLIFFFPALILSMVSPTVIKLTLADLGKTGGIVGTIYAFSTAGSILGTFMTGFFFILWFGTRMLVWLIAAILIFTGIITMFFGKFPSGEAYSLRLKRSIKWPLTIGIVLAYIFLYQYRDSWQEDYTAESNYFTIRVLDYGEKSPNIRALFLDNFDQSYVIPDEPKILVYEYLRVFEEIVRYHIKENPAPRVLHLGGGGYCFPRYMESVYPDSINEVVEIDPAVTKVAHNFLGLPLNTRIKTYNQDARNFLIKRNNTVKYDIVIGDVFNDFSTPYHLSTLEFNRLVKSHMKNDGVYLLNVNDFEYSQYTPSFVHTLKQIFEHVYLFNVNKNWEKASDGSLIITSTDRIIAATDHDMDLSDYMQFVTENNQKDPTGYPLKENELQNYLVQRKPLLLTDDYAPTDILLAPIFKYEYSHDG